jgi:hypothetical protein
VTQQILICYSGSEDAERAVNTAGTLLGPRDAVVLTAAVGCQNSGRSLLNLPISKRNRINPLHTRVIEPGSWREELSPQQSTNVAARRSHVLSPLAPVSTLPAAGCETHPSKE